MTFPVPGIDQPETTTHYVLYEDGSTGLLQTSNLDDVPELTKPGHFVTEQEYNEAVAQMELQRAEYVANLQAEDNARQLEDYQALRAAGVPEATARRMSGYDGPEPDEL